jgi:hypothetical protein
MSTKPNLLSRFYFSYNQFMVYDASVRLPGCDWTDEHSAQGFARRESTVNFGTILEFGRADLVVTCGAYQPREEYQRVIAVPFRVTSGNVIVEGPEEIETERKIELQPGNYRLIAAQRVTADFGEEKEEGESIDLFFELLPKPLERSAILVGDEGLNPPASLVENAGIAGEDFL